MNRKYLAGFLAAAAVLALLAFTVYSLFEIQSETRSLPASREARANSYLALDRWLKSSGIWVRVATKGNLSMVQKASEKHIFMQASLFSWSSEAEEFLAQWIHDGGHLFIVLDHVNRNMDSCVRFINKFGIEWKFFSENEGEKGRFPNPREVSESPALGHTVFFDVSEETTALALKDWTMLTKFVQVESGKGKLTVSGEPLFCYSENLNMAPNSRLAWALFFDDTEKSGWLFIRGKAKISGLFGNLFEEGNLAVLLVSVFVLLVVGLWNVIPMFGLVRYDDEKPGKPLRERFLAEGRFLKRYGALDFYRGIYVKEIKRSLLRREGISGDEETVKRLLEIWGRPSEEKEAVLLVRALNGEPFTYREFPKIINIFNTILERI